MPTKGKPLKHLKKYQFKKGRTAWNKGLTKDKDIRAKESSIRMKENNPMKRKDIKEKSSKSHLGNKPSEETRRKRSESMKGKNSKSGITSENERIRGSIEFRLWREAVFARDNWTCRKCKERGDKLHPHHIKNFAQFLELRFAIDNGITFCKECHKKFHIIYGRQDNTKKQITKYLYE